MSLTCISCKHYVCKVFSIQNNNGVTQELLHSLLECYIIVCKSCTPSLTQILYGDIYVAHLDLNTLDIYYIRGPNIYLLISNNHRHFFCHIYWRKFLINIVQKKKNSSSSSSSRWDVTKSLIYCTPPNSSSNDQCHFVKRNFIGSEGCGKLRLICRHYHNCLSEGVCVIKYNVTLHLDLHSKPRISSYNR